MNSAEHAHTDMVVAEGGEQRREREVHELERERERDFERESRDCGETLESSRELKRNPKKT